MLASAELARSNNNRTRSTLKHSICSHKWWETLKGTIFDVKPSIAVLRGPGGCLVVATAKKVSLFGSQFDSKQCCEQFVTPLSCFPQSRCNSLIFWTPIHPCPLLDRNTYGGVDHLGVFPLFLKIVIDSKSSIIFQILIC